MSTLLFLLMLHIGVLLNAQVQEPFTVRFNQSLHGDFTIIANNMISRTATGDYNGSSNNDNFFNNVYVDIDNDSNTFNSSSAEFTNPDLSVSCITFLRHLFIGQLPILRSSMELTINQIGILTI